MPDNLNLNSVDINNQDLSKQNLSCLNLKQKLGKLIFFDGNLSEPKGQSCASCHSPEVGFTDPDSDIATSEGATPGYFGSRNSPTAAYSTLAPVFRFDEDLTHGDGFTGLYVGGMFWDGRAATPILQAQGPFLNPIEMNNPDAAAVVSKVKKSNYAMLFSIVYGRHAFSDVSQAYDNIADAIVAYEQSNEVCKFTSKYDRYLKGCAKLTKQEKHGLDLFKGKAKCAVCHTADGKKPLFTDFSYANVGIPKNPNNPFYAMPYNSDGYNFVDLGLGPIVHNDRFNGFMKVPTLRNVAKTAPYLHNGLLNNLEDLVHFLNTYVDQRPDPEVDNNVFNSGGLNLTSEEESDLVAFLNTLTDK
jgi:cytochrome c peroxidase